MKRILKQNGIVFRRTDGVNGGVGGVGGDSWRNTGWQGSSGGQQIVH